MTVVKALEYGTKFGPKRIYCFRHSFGIQFNSFSSPSLWEVFSLQLVFMDWIYSQVKVLPFLKLTNLTNAYVMTFI
jgi:hypothetical protein